MALNQVMMVYGKKYSPEPAWSKTNHALFLLVAVHGVIYTVFAFIKALYFFHYPDKNLALVFYQEQVLSYFTLPAAGNSLLLKPWTLLTHMFLHNGIWDLLGNMLWLSFFGSVLQGLTGNKKMVPVYIYGGLAGAVAFISGYNILPGLNSHLNTISLLGASAGVMAVAVVTTMISPGYRIFPRLNGGIPLWIISAVFFVADLSTIPLNNPGGYMAQLGGAVFGLAFMFFLKRGYDWSKGMNHFFEWISNLFNPGRPRKGKHPKDELFYKSASRPFTKTPRITQQHIDEILDKINQKGYDFLTREEKEILKRASRNE